MTYILMLLVLFSFHFPVTLLVAYRILLIEFCILALCPVALQI